MPAHPAPQSWGPHMTKQTRPVVLLRPVPGDSVIHRLWAGTKILAVLGFSLLLSFYPGWPVIGFTALLVIVSGASHNGSGGASQNLNFGTAQITTGGPYNATTLVSGFALVPLGTGLSIGLVAADGTSPSFRAAASGYSTATTSVSFTWSSGAAFDAGTIKIYGIKA